MLYVASDAPTLCPELSLWVGPSLSLSLGHQPPDQCSCAQSRSQPLPRANLDLPTWGQRVERAVPPSPVCLCNYFCKNCLICGCHSLAPGLRPHLSSRTACTSVSCSGASEPPGSLAARPSELRPGTQQPAHGTSFWGLGVVCCSAGGLSSEPRERDPT